MNNKIETNLFWINNFRSELSLYSEAMSLFCGIILYHISDFNEPFSTALRNSLVKTALTNLTVCIYKMNPNASKEDVATSIRTFLYEYIEDYDSFELELLKYIPDVNSEEVFCYSILNASSDYDDLDDHESEDYIRQNLPVFLSYYKDVYVMTVPSPDIFLLFYIRLLSLYFHFNHVA